MEFSHNIVFDTSAFLAGLEKYYNRIYTTKFVIDEVKDFQSVELLNMAIDAGKIFILEPKDESVKKVRNSMRILNAYSLSETDISVAALAYDLRPSVVFTDDLVLQNLLLSLGIEYRSVKLKIKLKNKKRYKFKCEGCGREFDDYYSICPICGSKLKKIVY